MPITDQQFEIILTRLEAGEPLSALQKDFPALQEDLAALQDLQDFFMAQRLAVKPDPAGLKGVLRQIKALEAAEKNDDEPVWGAWFLPWKRSFKVALPALLILGTSGYVWQSQVANLNSATSKVADQAVVTELATVNKMEGAMALPAPVLAGGGTEDEFMDMAALAQSLSAEFASEISEFETTRSTLEPLYAEQLFSYQAPLNASTL